MKSVVEGIYRRESWGKAHGLVYGENLYFSFLFTFSGIGMDGA